MGAICPFCTNSLGSGCRKWFLFGGMVMQMMQGLLLGDADDAGDVHFFEV